MTSLVKQAAKQLGIKLSSREIHNVTQALRIEQSRTRKPITSQQARLLVNLYAHENINNTPEQV